MTLFCDTTRPAYCFCVRFDMNVVIRVSDVSFGLWVKASSVASRSYRLSVVVSHGMSGPKGLSGLVFTTKCYGGLS